MKKRNIYSGGKIGHGVEYWSGFLEWNFGVKCLRERETFILVVKLASFERTP